jgi:Domain of unknown function (DUF6321)
MRASEFITESWSQKYKKSINCSHPKGFSQKAHCAGRKKHNESVEMEMVCPDCNMCESHGNLSEIKKGAKDSNGFTKCWSGYHAAGTKKGKNGTVRNCVKNESLEEDSEKRCMQCGMKNCKCPGDSCKCKPIAGWIPGKGFKKAMEEAANAAQQAAIAVNMKKNHKKPKNESQELSEEFDLIESIISDLALRNGVNEDAVWEDLESLTDDELYVFAVTQPVNEDWQKVNKHDKTSGMSQKAVNAYRRENPGSKLKTAVTTKPSKLKRGSKSAKRRSSYCSRSAGQKRMHHIDCSKTPDKAICAARRRWNC